MLRKSIALCAFGMTISASVFASSSMTHFVHIPELKSGYQVDLALLFLRPGASNLNYGIYNKALPLLSPSWSEKELNPAFSPAFELDLGYVPKHASGKDIHLDWTHLDSETASASMTADTAAGDFIGPDYDIGPDGSKCSFASGAAQFDVDVINLDAGQHVMFGQHFGVRFFGGLSTGFLKEKLTDTYSGTVTTAVPSYQGIRATSVGPFSVTQYENSRYSGAGPRLGVDASYRMHSGFGFIGEGAVSALMGTMASTTNYLGTSQTLIDANNTIPNSQYIADQHVFQVIPGFDTKLGVDYKHDFASGVELVASTGYEAAVYINAISQYLPGSLVQTKGINTGSIYVETMNHVLSNYSIQGPFLKLGLRF